MMLSKWAALTGAALLAVVSAPGTRVSAQDQDTIVRTLDVFARTGQLGLSVDEVTGDAAKQAKPGVVVGSVTPDGPADKAGIKAGDAITEFDGERVRSVRQFLRLVQESAPGRSVPVTLSRNGQRVNVNITPEERSRGTRLFELPRATRIPRTPTPPTPPRAVRPPAFDEFRFDGFPGVLRLAGGGRLGVTIESVDDQLAEYFGVKEGVLIKSVRDGSPAQKAGLKAGDVVTGINGTKIYDTSDVSRAIDRVEDDGAVTIDVVRDRKPQQFKGKLEPRDDRRPRIRTAG